MENVSRFYDHWEYFLAIWYKLWPFGNLVIIWYIFGIFYQDKSGNPGANRLRVYLAKWVGAFPNYHFSKMYKQKQSNIIFKGL
jgi:hypothetical protein